MRTRIEVKGVIGRGKWRQKVTITKGWKFEKFVLVPRPLLAKPPIKHPSSTDENNLTPFEFAVATGILLLARAVCKNQRHQRAFKSGAAAIAEEQELADKFVEAWKKVKKARANGIKADAPKRIHTFIRINAAEHQPKLKRSRAIEYAGAHRYQLSLRALRRKPIAKDAIVTVAPYALLRVSGLNQNSTTARRLPDAIARLRSPVGSMPALLLDVKSDDGGLCLTVNHEWLNPPLAKVRLPLPIRSSFALALSLFVHGLDTYSPIGPAIPFKKLAAILGFPTSFGNGYLMKKLSLALDLLNDGLEDVRFDVTQGNLLRFTCYERRQELLSEGGAARADRKKKRLRSHAKADVEAEAKREHKHEIERIEELRQKKRNNHGLSRFEREELERLLQKIEDRHAKIDNRI